MHAAQQNRGSLDGEVPAEVLAAPGRLHSLNFSFTNRCRLRCVYCPQGSHPDEFYADVDQGFMDRLADAVRQFSVQHIDIGYYGDLLAFAGWETHAARLLGMGVALTATTNFARLLEPAEVATLARFREVVVSIDTHDGPMLKALRRSVDVGVILRNHHLLRAYCLAQGLAGPSVVWQGVLSDKVIAQLPEFVAFAASNGVKRLVCNDLGYFEMAANAPRNLADLPLDQVRAAVEQLTAAEQLAARLGVEFTFGGHERLARRLAASERTDGASLPTVSRKAPQGALTFAADASVPPGHTRLCALPWTAAYLGPRGEVYSCCARGALMGQVDADTELATVLSAEPYRQLRRALYTGEGLDPACAYCHAVPTVAVGHFQRSILRDLQLGACAGWRDYLRPRIWRAWVVGLALKGKATLFPYLPSWARTGWRRLASVWRRR